MKRYLLIVLTCIAASLAAQEVYVSPETLAKREKRKNLTVKEWNTNDKTKTRWLDRVKVYDEQGRVIEETEYATYGQKWRLTYEYTDAVGGKVAKEVEYNDKNRPVRIRKYEYNANGTKAKQYNYLPNGKLESVKVFEYIFEK
ncbi:MAG: hypothetical protein J6T76_03745 [Paludibacteraceae bacterium]|nr:hypothetical protein [Paludibacteraceae bacterium]